jgi:hypothetical protein
MQPDVRELAAQIEPDCSAKRPPTAAERVVLAEIVPSFRVQSDSQKGRRDWDSGWVGGVVRSRVVRFGIFGRHQLQNTPLEQQEACASVNTSNKSVRGLALFAFARQPYVADLSGLERFSGSGALESCLIIIDPFQWIHACDDILVEIQHPLNLVHIKTYVGFNEHQMGFRR